MKKEGKIGLGAAAVIGINAMIGAGVVGMPAVILASGSGPAGILGYTLTIVIAIFIGLSIANVAEIYPEKAWSYAYAARWGGHTVGMVSAWCYVIGVLIAMGFIAQQTGVWVHDYFLPNTNPQLIGALILVILAGLVLAGAEASSFGQYIIVAFVLIPLIITSFICWLNLNPIVVQNFSIVDIRIGSVFSIASTALYTLMGFESIASLYSSIKNPKKNVSRACVISILIVGSLYMFFASGVLLSIPEAFFINGLDQSLASIISQAFPKFTYLSTLLLIGGLFAMIGTLHSMIWSLSSLLTDVLEKSNSKVVKNLLREKVWNNTISILVTSGVIMLTALFIKPGTILSATVIFIALTYALSSSLLFFEKKAWLSGKNIITLLAVSGCLAMMYFAFSEIIAL